MTEVKTGLDNITKKKTSCVARFTMFGVRKNKSFAHKDWGSEKKAEDAAQNHLSQMRALYDMTEEPCDSNIGMPCIHYHIDNHKSPVYTRVYYKVYFFADRNPRSGKIRKDRHAYRTFVAGIQGVDTIKVIKAFLAAKLFRRVYELHYRRDLPFDYESFLANWETKPLSFYLKPYELELPE